MPDLTNQSSIFLQLQACAKKSLLMILTRVENIKQFREK